MILLDFALFYLPLIPLAFFTFFFLVTCLVVYKGTYIVQQAEVIILERFGKFHSVLGSGIHFVVPFIDSPRKIMWSFIKEGAVGKNTYRYVTEIERIDLRENVYDFAKQGVITKDNVTMEINALLYYQVTDPKAAAYEVNNLPYAIEKLTQTTLRNIIGSLDLDETLTSRDSINEKLRIILDEATDKWGLKVNRVELQEVNPPADIRNAMEKQMRAERDRRALILEAEGLKQAAILKAEGEKLSAIARATGDSQARVLLAQAESQAIQTVMEKVKNEDAVLRYLVAINYIKALPEITKDKEGKMVILPYESSSLMGSLTAIKELWK